MRPLSFLGAMLALPLLTLQASDYWYDYGYPPPEDALEGLGAFRVGADWLYMKPAVDDLYYAETIAFIPGASGSFQRHEPQFSWDSGVQVALGYDLPLDQWALNATWTYFNTAASRSDRFVNAFGANDVSGGINDVLFNNSQGTAVGAYRSSGFWKWNFNQLDIDFSRVSYFNRAVTIRPVAGFRFLWSDQKLNSRFTFLSSPDGVEISEVHRIRNLNIYKAFGVKFGLDSTWDIGFAGVALYGNIDFALLIGNFHVGQKVSIRELEVEPPAAQRFDLNNHSRSLKQMVTASFGIQWTHSFCCDESRLVVKAGWEHIYLPNFNALIQRDAALYTIGSANTVLPSPVSVRSDMGLYGLVLGADFYF